MQRGARGRRLVLAAHARGASTTLARLAKPYKLPHLLAIGSLARRHADRARAALPRKARDRPRHHAGDLKLLGWIVAAFLVAGVVELGRELRPDVLHRLDRRADPRRPAQRLFRHLQRLSLGYYERNRAGVIISRLTNDVEALDQLVTDGVTTLVQNTLMLVGVGRASSSSSTGGSRSRRCGLPLMAARDGALPLALVPRVPARARAPRRSSPPRSPRTSPACASSRRSRASAPACERFREVNDALPRGEPRRPSS